MRVGRICGVIAETKFKHVKERIKEAETAEIDLLEIRVDYLTDPFSAVDKLKPLLEEVPLPIILTTRTSSENGHLDLKGKDWNLGKLQRFIECLIEAQPSYIDLQLNFSDPMFLDLLHSAHKASINVIGSIHLPKEKSSTIYYKQALDRANELKADIVKIIGNPSTFTGYTELTQLLVENVIAKRPIIAYCKGAYGRFSRIVAYFSGCEFVYCPLNQETAFGKFNTYELRNLAMSISSSNN
ncbi:MAG: type I 3-dehydroquinate dehydratase [Candidatus Hodarchaeota archaeon]